MAELSAAEFALWLPIPEALKRLPPDWPSKTARETLWSWLAIGKLQAAAEIADYPRAQQSRHSILPVALWRRDRPHPEASFWLSGNFEITTPRRTSHRDSYVPEAYEVTRLVGIRVDPTGLPPPQVGDEPLSETPAIFSDVSSKPPLSDHLLKRWAELFRDAYPNGSEKLAILSLDGMFPDKSVTRGRLRQVLPRNRPGRPLRDKEKS